MSQDGMHTKDLRRRGGKYEREVLGQHAPVAAAWLEDVQQVIKMAAAASEYCGCGCFSPPWIASISLQDE